MPRTELNKESVLNLICPALNILRAIELNVQEHECVYHPKVKTAVDNLLKLVTLSEKR